MLPHPLTPAGEYNEILARRTYDEELKSLFVTGFWRYPKSQETIPVELGGQGFDYIPFEKSVSMERLITISNPLSEEAASKIKPPALKIENNGPALSDKLERKPWLAKFLLQSPARRPQSLPECHSYFTSPVVSSLERTRRPKKKYDVNEGALISSTTLKKESLAGMGPPQPHRGLHSPEGFSTGRSFESPDGRSANSGGRMSAPLIGVSLDGVVREMSFA